MILRVWAGMVASVLIAALSMTTTSVATVAVEIGEPMPIVQPDVWAIMTIIAEAASEPLDGQVAVGNVIRNRMARKYTSDGTVIGTVLRPKQFSCWDDKARLYVANIDIDSPVFSVAVEAWMRSRVNDVTDGAVLYHTHAVNPYWSRAPSVNYIKTIGAHKFYDER